MSNAIDRSARAEVRNPLLRLPSVRALQGLDAQSRGALRALLMDLACDAGEIAEKSWKARKGLVAAYWKAVSTWSRHAARLLKGDRGAPTAAEAFRIADEAMEELLQAHCMPAGGGREMLEPCGDSGRPVSRLSLAADEVREAYAWLSRRGLARMQRVDERELIVFIERECSP